eukprot:COSAG02_NODE_15340_length_1180_cov_1.337650_2_plen_76_part_01
MDLYYPDLLRHVHPDESALTLYQGLGNPGTVIGDTCDVIAGSDITTGFDVNYAQDPDCPNVFTGHRLYSLNVAWPV